MSTARFEPTPLWLHALQEPACPCHHLVLATTSGDVVGWCRAFPSDETHHNGEVTIGVGLLEKHCNQGIGTAMVLNTLDWARAARYAVASLEVHPANSRAQRVFTRCGFRPVRQSVNAPLMMVCALQPSLRLG